MIELKRLNVVKYVETEEEAAKWERKGFKRTQATTKRSSKAKTEGEE